MALQIRRGTDAERTGVIFAEGELIYVTTTDALYIGDGSTAGGVKLTDNAGAVLGTYITANTINSTIDLQQDLDLNGNDIIGTGNININGTVTATGNINIGDDANTDTVDFTAKITSSLTPSADSTHNIGAMNARWNNGYFTGLWVDGQINAVSLNGDVLANDSTLLVNATSGKIVGDVVNSRVITELVDAPTDDLYVTAVNDGTLYLGTTNTRTVTIGAVDTTVYVNGDQDSVIAGGQFLGDLKGSVFGDDSTLIIDAVANTLNGNLTGNVTGDLTGNVVGVVTGNVKGSISNDPIIDSLQGPADAIINAFDITATGTISGNLTGDVTGNVTGNTTGYHTGDVKGSVFADGSTLLVDAVAGSIPGENITGTVTASFAGNLTGDVVGNTTGTHIGNIETSLIDSSDSTAITVTPIMEFNSDVIINNSLFMNPTGNPGGDVIKIDSKGTVSCVLLETQRIVHSDGGEIIFGNRVGFDKTTTFAEQATFIDKLSVQTITGEVEGIFAVETFTGDPDDDDSVANPANYNKHFEATNEKATFGVPVKFPVYADASARNTAVPNPEIGMVVIVGTTMQLNTDGTTGGWVSVTTS